MSDKQLFKLTGLKFAPIKINDSRRVFNPSKNVNSWMSRYLLKTFICSIPKFSSDKRENEDVHRFFFLSIMPQNKYTCNLCQIISSKAMYEYLKI